MTASTLTNIHTLEPDANGSGVNNGSGVGNSAAETDVWHQIIPAGTFSSGSPSSDEQKRNYAIKAYGTLLNHSSGNRTVTLRIYANKSGNSRTKIVEKANTFGSSASTLPQSVELAAIIDPAGARSGGNSIFGVIDWVVGATASHVMAIGAETNIGTWNPSTDDLEITLTVQWSAAHTESIFSVLPPFELVG